MENTYELNIKY